jgi:hypothetical protein
MAGLGVSDEDVFNAALTDQRAVLTLNRKHFMQLHRERPRHSGDSARAFWGRSLSDR